MFEKSTINCLLGKGLCSRWGGDRIINMLLLPAWNSRRIR